MYIHAFMHFFHLFCGRLNLSCSLQLDHFGFQHLPFRVLMKSDTESHHLQVLFVLFFFFQYWKLFPAACTKIDWAGKQMNNDFFQVLLEEILFYVMNRPSVYYYLLSIFVYMPFPFPEACFLGLLKAVCYLWNYCFIPSGAVMPLCHSSNLLCH